MGRALGYLGRIGPVLPPSPGCAGRFLGSPRSARTWAASRAPSRPTGRGVLRRTIDESTLEKALTIPPTVDKDRDGEILPVLEGLIEALTNYLMASAGDDDREIRATLATLQKAAENAENTATQMREDRGDILPGAVPTPSLAALRPLAQDILKDTRGLLTAKSLAADEAKYSGTTEPRTLAALKSGKAKHLMITPKPGSSEAKGAGELYPKDTPVEDEMQLALPTRKGRSTPFDALTVDGPVPTVLDVLALGGGHGGVNATFEEADEFVQGNGGRKVKVYTGRAFEKQYWADTVVKPMVNRGVRAKLIVLDACLTASMIDVFAPLCAPGGKIMASMYSINAKVMTPETWSKVIGGEGSEGIHAVTQSAQEVNEGATAHAINTVFGMIRSSPYFEVEELVKREPGLAPLVSRIRYLPRIVNEMANFLRAKSDGRRGECLESLRGMHTASPPCDPADAKVADLVADFLEASASDPDHAEFTTGMARDVIKARLSVLTKVDQGEVTDLLALLDTDSKSEMTKTGAGTVPAQVAVYDHDRKEIRFDQLFSEKAPRKRMEDSTGTESAREMRQVEEELKKIAAKLGASLKALPAKQVVRGHEGPSITLSDPDGKETALL